MKMKFSVPTTWEDGFIGKIKLDGVDELYGKLASDAVGGGRSSYILPDVSKQSVSRHIKEARKNGLKFNYLLNAVCLDNQEFTSSGQKRLRSLLDWLSEMEVDSVTVAIPYLLELIKRQYPRFKVAVSVFALIDTIEKACYWEGLGADELTLSLSVNRDFELIKAIRRNVKCILRLIPNLHCLYQCPFSIYHSCQMAHSSQAGHASQGFIVDYCYIKCRSLFLKDPSHFIKSTWIRPEDVHYYEEYGIDRMKLVNRGMTADKIRLIAGAYAAGRYEGNLLDLLPHPQTNVNYRTRGFFMKLKYFFHPFKVNLLKLREAKDLISAQKVFIPNRELDGFIEHFIKGKCHVTSCSDCSYCEETARRVVKIDKEDSKEAEDRYRDFLDKVVSGDLFRYF